MYGISFKVTYDTRASNDDVDLNTAVGKTYYASHSTYKKISSDPEVWVKLTLSTTAPATLTFKLMPYTAGKVPIISMKF